MAITYKFMQRSKAIELMYENAWNQGFYVEYVTDEMTVEHVCQYSSKLKGSGSMERNTITKEYTIRTATEEESDSIITLLKEVAQWLQHKEVDQWRYLLGGEATDEILEGIREKYTYVITKEDEMTVQLQYLLNKMNGMNIFW